MQLWFGMCDSGMEHTLCEITSMYRFVRLSLTRGSIPDEMTILSFRHLLEKHRPGRKLLHVVAGYLSEQSLNLREAIIVDASLFEAQSSAKSKGGKQVKVKHPCQIIKRQF